MKIRYIFYFLFFLLPVHIFGKTADEYQKELDEKKEKMAFELETLNLREQQKIFECQRNYRDKPEKLTSCLQDLQKEQEQQTADITKKYNKEIEELTTKHENQVIIEYTQSKQKTETIAKK